MKHYQLGLYEKSMPAELTLPEKLELVRTYGFDYLEMSIDETDEKIARLEMPLTQRAELLAAVQATGTPVGSICLSAHRRYPLGSGRPEVAEKSLAILRGTVDLAVQLGVRTIQLAGYDVYYEPSGEDTRRRFEENLRLCVEYAAARGTMLGFETMETDFMNTVVKAMHYVEQINSPYLGVYPDVGNLTNAALKTGGSIAVDLRKGAGHICAVHLKETRPGVFREVSFGTGHVDFQAAVGMALALGVRRFVTEFWYTGSPHWRADIESANRFARNLFA